MKRPRISKAKRHSLTTFIIDPLYIKAKSDLESALKSRDEWARSMDYCVENGSTEFPLIRVLHEISANDCLKDVATFERLPDVVNGSPFLKENGYRDDFFDDLY